MSQALSPKSPRKGKHISLRVIFLDDLVHAFQCPVKSVGQVLWDAVMQHLSLLESDYFDLMFNDETGQTCWLDRDKQITKQLPTPDTPLTFCVKFYTPDPGLLEDELTRYLFALQTKRDLATGLMPCSENTAALLASYIAQAEIGDFLVDEYTDHTYLSTMKFVLHQTTQLEQKIMEYHRQHIGESPSEADSNLLDTARKVEMYGIRLHPAKDHEQVSLSLAVAHMGVLVFQNFTKINTFSWAKIRKLSFKRKKFLIKLHPDSYVSTKGFYKDTVEFFLETRNDCKAFWKKCIEHHAFFRCQVVRKVPRNKTRVVSRGSSFRYSGRTQKQLVEYVRETIVKRPQFERSTSGRISSRSASVTPKINAKTAIHNSSDIHNSTASSGSHILDPLTDNHVSPTRVEMAEVHSDSSMSGSRSLGSPKLEHGLVISDSMESANHKTDEEMRFEDASNLKRESEDKVSSPTAPHPPPSPYSSFNYQNRKFSAPVLGLKNFPESIEEENRISRSSEVENIPEFVIEEEHNAVTNRNSLKRTTSEASTKIYELESIHHQESPSPPPPPPPPIFEEDYTPSPPSPLQENNISMLTAATFAFSPNTSNLSSRFEDHEEDTNKKKSKRHTGDDSYYITKELLSTERTYKKDLEVVCVWFRNAVSGDDEILNTLTELLFSYLDPIYEFHVGFLKKLDLRLQQWEGKSPVINGETCQKIGDLILDAVVVFEQLYQNYLNREQEMLTEIDQKLKCNKRFEEMYKDFESQKVCYLPLNTFFLKPGQRLLHYKIILERLIKFYPPPNPDLTDCREALAKILELTTAFQDKMKRLENLQKLMELQRDLVGMDSLVSIDRMFIREGCLQKYSRKGYQQRMFFLFSDMLVYTSRTATSLLQFKVHGQLPLRGMIVEESEQSKIAIENCFAIYAGNKYILVAASSQEEKDKWVEDLNEAIVKSKSNADEKNNYPSLKSSASSSENVESSEQPSDKVAIPTTEKQIQHRANTTMHVCWHRNTSVSMKDHSKATRNQLSGYLLRKFKNSNGWQKLWVVFTNFCLFFYKSFQDDFPLASLPLLGYAISKPDEEDDIQKDHVFKLQFKNHIYFFRAESEYTFNRWMEVINSATHNACRIRLFSRLESEQH